MLGNHNVRLRLLRWRDILVICIYVLPPPYNSEYVSITVLGSNIIRHHDTLPEVTVHVHLTRSQEKY
jgi:hypothetical protein